MLSEKITNSFLRIGQKFDKMQEEDKLNVGGYLMNIHISALIQKMEEELRQAKTASRDEEVKMHVAAVRSLCDVVLDRPSHTASAPPQAPISKAAPSPSASPSTDPLLLEKMMGSAGLNQYQKKSKDEREEDGNGDSIFDF
ncbi:YwdI family protein [Bacillus nakamurai]|uniref:YwdI family protein n=1 Tax=Bacillus nakamurai TaxID=1793963 RepID=UPI00281583B8|nr:YwdI family protein [Bacillus nakamurai]